jgi:hypothetical protein
MAWVPVFGQLRIVRDLAGVTSGGTSPEVYENVTRPGWCPVERNPGLPQPKWL